ncbi:MAG: response regulator transcription factor [Oscillospiraceae bacterium]|jgi:DNA-binding response OmpR family regulator|nr:response regulator transcription factor [Oscillospiraceae bacterium]
MFSILFVDDEQAIREGFAEYAQFLGYEVTQAADGMEAVERCRKQDFDVVILDIMMPRMDGFTACKEIRREKDIPILMLSARGEEYDKLHGFDLGIDDYVTKPFSPRELLARLNVIVNRHKAAAQGNAPGATKNEVYRFGGLVIDMSARTVETDGRRLEMTPKEYELLFHLVRNHNIALSREKLLSAVWGYDFFGEDATVNTHIKMLRAHLGIYERHIVTIRGVGYRFDPVLEEAIQ